MSPPFRTVLIANRGEIALRIARTCRELGIRVVAAHSTEDRDCAVVRDADARVQIGPAPARQSYLNMAAIIEAARQTGADAIHPGYGFLSENPDFPAACAANGIVFVGPPADVIARLGDKIAARDLMSRAGIPLLPGVLHALDSVDDAKAAAGRVGYPLIIKASAGGGGRGMRVVTGPDRFAAAYHEVRAAAQALFGDGRVYLERYLPRARHVEIQVLADRYGGVVHLGERDCSVQRRHQKLVEETPAPRLPSGLLARMAGAAVAGARAAGYLGAGTVEFLVDGDDFYFMEVNCRIQVEHPVTEMATGVDLVREQLLVAAGHPLAVNQRDLLPRGAAIECRVNAEDPARDFAPVPGRLRRYEPPAGPFVRVDTHGHPGYRIPAAYDSLLAKVVVWAPDRPQALARMRRALTDFHVEGVATTIPFLLDVLRQPAFVEGRHRVDLVDAMRADERPSGTARAAVESAPRESRQHRAKVAEPERIDVR